MGASLDENVYAPYMLTSPYTNGGLANTVSYFMEQNGFFICSKNEYYTGERCFIRSYAESDNGKVLEYELYPQLRETGGKATYAGVYGGDLKNSIIKMHTGCMVYIFHMRVQ